jgi:glycosyltransferase involved in cell wall biosynthesis
MPPLVSVIIPAYNAAQYIGETLQSVMQQTINDFEIVIVDDGATDNQKEVITAFVEKDSRVKYIYQSHQGVSAARNTGFRNSQGKFIAFLDSDDVWLPKNLEVKLKKLERENIGLVHSDASVIDAHSNDVDTTLTGMEGELLDELLLWRGTQIPGPSSILMKRQVIDLVGLFDENLSTAADKEFFFRVAAKFRIGRIEQTTWKYRVHTNNMHKNISRMESDVLFMYEKARNLNLFHSKQFERKCFSAMYLILAACWAGEEKNLKRGLLFAVKAIRSNPAVIFSIGRRALQRWVLN